jgi:hypothetical protein
MQQPSPQLLFSNPSFAALLMRRNILLIVAQMSRAFRTISCQRFLKLGVAAVARGVRILTIGEGKSSSGFVTFKSKQAAVDARQV